MLDFRVEEFWQKYQDEGIKEKRMEKMQFKAHVLINLFFTKGLTKERRVEEIRKFLVNTCDDLIEFKNQEMQDLKDELRESQG